MTGLYSHDTAVCSCGGEENLSLETKDYGKMLKNTEAGTKKIPSPLKAETENRKHTWRFSL